MKKDNKRKTRNRPTSTTPQKSDIHSVGTVTKKEETKAEELTKAEKIAIVTVIVSIIAVIVSIIAIIVSIVVPYRINRQNTLNREIESLIENINNSNIKIQESFNFNAIEIDSLSSPDFRYVKSFQDTVKKSVQSWRYISKVSSKSELKKHDLDELWEITMTLKKNGEYFDNKIKNITAYIDIIENYGKQNKIDDYLVSDEKRLFLRIGESQSAALNFMKMSIDHDNSLKNYNKNKLVKFIKKFEKIRKSKNNLENIDILFATIIELNDMYMNHINDEIKKRQILQATIGEKIK